MTASKIFYGLLQPEMHMHARMLFVTGGILVFTRPSHIDVKVKFWNFNAERWRILERVKKYVICIQNVGAATACTHLSKGRMGLRYLLECFAPCCKISKKALVFSYFLKA